MNRRLAKSSLLNVLDHVVKFAAVFFVTPALASGLGEHLYGVWLLVMAFFSYYTFLDAGMGLAGVRYLAREMGKSTEETRFGDVVVTCQRIFRRIAVLSVFLTMLGLLGASLFVSDLTLRSQVWMVLGVCGTGVAVRFWLMMGPVLLKSRVDYAPIVWVSVVRTAAQAALTLWCLHQGWGLVGLAWVLGSCDVLQQVAVHAWAHRKTVPRGQWTRPLQRELWAYSMKTFVARLGINLKDKIDPFVVGALAGSIAVPQLVVGTRFLGIARDLVNALFGGPFLASFSRTEAADGRAKVRSDLFRALGWSAPFATLLGLGMGMLGPAFMERWMGPGFAQAGHVLELLVIPYVLFLMQYPAFGMMFAVGEHGALGRAAWWGSGVNLSLSILLGWWFGLMGVVWATVIDLTLIYGGVFPILVVRVVGGSVRTYLWALIRSTSMVLLPGLLYWRLVRDQIRPDYGAVWVLGMGLVGVVGLVTMLGRSWKQVDRV